MGSLLSFLFRLSSRLPLPVLHNLGSAAGWLAWLASPAYRRHLAENLAQAGQAAVRNTVIAESGKTVCEMPAVWFKAQAAVVDFLVDADGWELLEDAWRRNRGVLVLTAHLGSFEMVLQALVGYRLAAGDAGRPLTVLYRRSKQPWLETLIQQGRGAHMKLAPGDLGGVRRLLRALKDKETVAVLPDQVPGNGEGVWAPFFGRPAYTMTLAPRLARTGATVLLTYAERLHYGAGYRLHFLPPTGDATTPAGINREIEQLILRHPGQYLWGYNRYKGDPPQEPASA